MKYPKRPPDIKWTYWVRFSTRWEFIKQIDDDIFRYVIHQNKRISDLWAITATAHNDKSVHGAVWCDKWQAYQWADDEYVSTYFGFNDAKCTPQAWTIIRAKVAEWTREDEPEEELPEEPPDEEIPDTNPIEEGDGILDNVWDTIKSWIKEAILAGLAFLDKPLDIIEDLVSKLSQTISGIVEAVKGAISTVMAKVVGMFDTVVQKIKGVIDKVWENIELVWMTLKDMFDTVKTAILIAFEKSWIFIKETFTTLWTKMKEGLTYIGNAIVEGLKYLWDKIKDALNWVWDILNNAYKSIVAAVTAVWDRFKEKLTETIESIKVAFGDFVDRIIEWWESYMDWRDKNTENLQNWTEEKIVDTIKFMLRAQKTVLEDLARER